MATSHKILLVPDEEYAAEEYWESMRVHEPAIAREFEVAGAYLATPKEFERLRRLPGFADGPAHARNAVLVAEESDAIEFEPREAILLDDSRLRPVVVASVDPLLPDDWEPTAPPVGITPVSRQGQFLLCFARDWDTACTALQGEAWVATWSTGWCVTTQDTTGPMAQAAEEEGLRAWDAGRNTAYVSHEKHLVLRALHRADSVTPDVMRLVPWNQERGATEAGAVNLPVDASPGPRTHSGRPTWWEVIDRTGRVVCTTALEADARVVARVTNAYPAMRSAIEQASDVLHDDPNDGGDVGLDRACKALREALRQM